MSKRWLLSILCLTLLLTGRVAAQETCVMDHIAANTNKNAPQLGIAPPDVELLVQEVAGSIGLSPAGITIVPCDYTEKVQAWYSPGPPDLDAPEGDYILYQPKWVEEVIGENRVQAIALFGHELGHLLGRHFTSSKNLPPIQKETDADRFAGCAVGRLNGNWNGLADLLSRLRPPVDGSYPSRKRSLAAARDGFDKCGGKDEPPDDPYTIYRSRDPADYLEATYERVESEKAGKNYEYTVVVSVENKSPVPISGSVKISFGYYIDCDSRPSQFEHDHYASTKFKINGNEDKEVEVVSQMPGTVSSLFSGDKCGGVLFRRHERLKSSLVRDLSWQKQ